MAKLEDFFKKKQEFIDIEFLKNKILIDGIDDAANFCKNQFGLSENQFYEILEDAYKIHLISLNKFLLIKPHHEINLLTKDCVVLNECDEFVDVAVMNPSDVILKRIIKSFFKPKKVNFFLCTKSDISGILNESKFANEVVKFTNELILDAISHMATDVHFKSEDGCIKIFFRCNGEIFFYGVVEFSMWEYVKRRFKIIAGLNIAEQIVPQSGSAKLCYLNQYNYIRVSTHPGVYGENISIRILGSKNLELNIEKLGFDEEMISKIRTAISYPKGLFLVAGPVGVGKTTTIYSILKEFKNKNIMTIEDPVEIIIPEFKQTDINDGKVISYDDCIRSILRHDPDIIFIGEIRDEITAKSAVRASLTGKLVLTTIHAYNSIEAFYRLIDFGVSFNDLMNVINGVMSQRLFTINHERRALGEIILFSNEIKKNKYSSVRELFDHVNGFETMNEKTAKYECDGKISHDERVNVLGFD